MNTCQKCGAPIWNDICVNSECSEHYTSEARIESDLEAGIIKEYYPG
jgi:hypothetical protein